MRAAANEVITILGRLVKPRLVIAIGGARPYTDNVIQSRIRFAPAKGWA
jgi:hypothetical protein